MMAIGYIKILCHQHRSHGGRRRISLAVRLPTVAKNERAKIAKGSLER